jgi:hypothetical protein
MVSRISCHRSRQSEKQLQPGLPDFFGKIYQNGENIPNDNKLYPQIYHIVIKYSK